MVARTIAALNNQLRDGQTAGAIVPAYVRDVADTLSARTGNLLRVTDPEVGADPTGGADSFGALSAAFAGSATTPVYVPFGAYKSSAPLTIPDRGVVIAEEINTWDFFNRAWKNNTVIFASGSWSTNTAIINLGNYSYCRGITTQGFYDGATMGSDLGVDGFRILDKLYPVLWGCYAVSCREGFNMSPNGSNTQGMELHHCRASKNAGYGFYSLPGGGGGSWSDNKMVDCSTAFNTTGEVYLNQTFNNQILGCRFEDSGGIGLEIQNGYTNVVVGCLFDRNTQSIKLGNHGFSTFTGNKFGVYTGSAYDIGIGGTCPNLHFAGNTYEGHGNYIYSASGATVSGAFFENAPSGVLGVYADAGTAAVLMPLVKTEQAASTSIANSGTLTLFTAVNGSNYDVVAADAAGGTARGRWTVFGNRAPDNVVAPIGCTLTNSSGAIVLTNTSGGTLTFNTAVRTYGK